MITVLGNISSLAAPPESKAVRNGAVTVRAYADRSAVEAGGILNLAVAFEIEKGWHVYWRGPGGLTGMPTEIVWSGPKGTTFSRTQFPVPEAKYDKEIDETSFILEGNPVFVTPVRLPSTLESQKEVVFRLQSNWLACLKSCIPGSAELSLAVPVGKSTEPANAKIFAGARAHFPIAQAAAEHLRFSGQTSPDEATPGGKFNAFLSVQIAPKHHMPSNRPLLDSLIPAMVFLEPTPGFEFEEVVYPPGKERTDAILEGKLSEYEGRVEFRIPILVDKDANKTPRWVRGVFRSQICTDAGVCYRPQFVEFAIPVRMERGLMPSGSPDDEPTHSSTAESSAKTYSETQDEGGNVFVRLQDRLINLGYYGVLIAAFIGGLILNLMPCVLPVISLKVLSFVRQAHEDRGRILRLGLTYSAGILVFFGVLAALFAWTGEGWGQLFQRPQVVLALAGVVTAFALSLFGVFAIFPPKIVNKLDEKVEGEGYSSAFATGLLATFLGTACTAPFLSAAVGAAVKYPGIQGAMIFFAVGVGMAFPFIVLAAQPAWVRFVPRPGPWMGTFEALMGFLLLGTAIWLMNPLRDQIGDFGLLLSLIFLLFVAMAAWVKGKIQFADEPVRKLKLNILALVILVAGWLIPFKAFSSIPRLREEVSARRKEIRDGRLYAALKGAATIGAAQWNPDWNKGIPWLDYDKDRIRSFVEAGYTVFVDYTASWCVNCKVNLKSSIDIEKTRGIMKELNVVPFEADYTNQDAEIEASLKYFGKAGVPLYLVYSPGEPDKPQVLPEVLTPSLVEGALRRAGPSKVAMAAKAPLPTP